jgi:hypothetical protein
MFLSIYHDIFRPHLFLRLLQLRNYLRATLRGLLVHMLLLLRTNSISSSTSMQIFLFTFFSPFGLDRWDRFVPFSAKSSKSYTSHMQPFCFRVEWHMEIIVWFDCTSAFFVPTLATLEYWMHYVWLLRITSMTQLFRSAAYLKHRGGEGEVGLREAQRYRLCPCSTISVPWALCGSQNNS